MGRFENYREGSISCLGKNGFHKMSYREWGHDLGEHRGTVVCVHGLTRNASDFDDLAADLAEARWRVICPDIVGRGASDWLTDPIGYDVQQYLSDLTALLARLDTVSLHWVGTSMGGILGIILAALPGNPLNSLFINDIGPFVPKAALGDIDGYLSDTPLYPDLDAAEVALRQRYEPFGPLDDATWRRVTLGSTMEVEDGYKLSYDPAIARPFAVAAREDIDLWALWDSLELPVATLRGGDSTLLLAETAAEMTRRGPQTELHERVGVGHAPWLKHHEEIAIVRDWLERCDRGAG